MRRPRRPRFEDIRDFYTHIDEAIDAMPKPERSCGGCVMCCGCYSLYLSRYEFEYLEDYLTRTTGSCPVEWVTCSTADEDPRLKADRDAVPRCPLSVDGLGCLGYEARPLACRTFGAFLPTHSKIPPGCVYTSPTVYSSVVDLPHYDEYELLQRRHYPLCGYFVAREVPQD